MFKNTRKRSYNSICDGITNTKISRTQNPNSSKSFSRKNSWNIPQHHILFLTSKLNKIVWKSVEIKYSPHMLTNRGLHFDPNWIGSYATYGDNTTFLMHIPQQWRGMNASPIVLFPH